MKRMWWVCVACALFGASACGAGASPEPQAADEPTSGGAAPQASPAMADDSGGVAEEESEGPSAFDIEE